MLKGSSVAVARQRAGLSQAAVSKATGINRTILSAFETGQLVVNEAMERRLREFFEAQGEELDAVVESPPIEPAERDSTRRPDHNEDLQIRDGLLLPENADVEQVETLLKQLGDVEDRIAALGDTERETFLGMLSRTCEEKFDELVLLHARAHCLIEQIQGRPSSTPLSREKWLEQPDTLTSWLGRAFERIGFTDPSNETAEAAPARTV